MSSRSLHFGAICLVLQGAVFADDVIYRYEGDVLPHDPSEGWLVFDPCDPPCSESLEDGHFVLFWPQAGNLANYTYRIAEPPEEPPPRSGPSGDSVRTTPKGRISIPAMPASS